MNLTSRLRLGFNIDHIATLRQVRAARYPDPVAAAVMAEAWGINPITLHCREDRRHIQPEDVFRLRQALRQARINLEIAPTQAMVDLALSAKVEAVCLVPEKRQELTTEGGLDLGRNSAELAATVAQLQRHHIRVSLFVDPVLERIYQAQAIKADVVELNTGAYAEADSDGQKAQLAELSAAAHLAHELGLEVHAGHGLTRANVTPVAALAPLAELNIGHALVAEAVFIGLEQALKDMRQLLDHARQWRP